MRRSLAFGVALLGSLYGLPADGADKGDASKAGPVYDKWCSQCHGATGGGDGPGAAFMMPRPRVFTDNPMYKFRVTASESIPTDDDLYRTIERGIPGTTMPGFPNLSDAQRWDLVAWIKSKAEEFSDPDEIEEAKPFEELASLPPRPAMAAESIETGRKLYDKAKCWKCHGKKGLGDGPSWPTLKDSWEGEAPTLPANLSNPESYRGGATANDLYRTITSGLAGTPMPEYRSSIPPDERWHLVNYIMSLYGQKAAAAGGRIIATQVEAVPAGLDDAAWAVAPAVRFRTFPNVIEPPRLFWQAVEFVSVQALYTEDRIALRLQWDDRRRSKGTNLDKDYLDRDTQVYRDTDHPDQVAIQFPVRAEDRAKRPYLLMGDRKRPTNLWWWRSDTDRFAERNAKGFQRIADQPAESQQLEAKTGWADGRYTVVVQRPLTTADAARDVQFEPGDFVPILFNLWDGDLGELGQRRALTVWCWLYLEAGIPAEAYAAPPVAFVLTLLVLLGLVRRTRSLAATEGGSDDEV